MPKAAGQLTDVERRSSPDILVAPKPLTCITNGHCNHPPSMPNLSSRPFSGESDFGDSSGPLLSIYSKITEEADNMGVERCQRDSEAVMIFVSTLSFHNVAHLNCNYRLVYSRPPSPRYFQCQPWI